MHIYMMTNHQFPYKCSNFIFSCICLFYKHHSHMHILCETTASKAEGISLHYWNLENPCECFDRFLQFHIIERNYFAKLSIAKILFLVCYEFYSSSILTSYIWKFKKIGCLTSDYCMKYFTINTKAWKLPRVPIFRT